MRGGKWTMWEGGTHLTGFIHAPSHLPAKAQNFTGLMHQCDWVPTLVGAAGVSLTAEELSVPRNDFEDHDIPPMDGINMWPTFTSGNTTDPGPRNSVLLNVC